METGNARRKFFELGGKACDARSEFGGRDVGCPCAGALHRIGEAETMIGQETIVLRQERFDTERLADGKT